MDYRLATAMRGPDHGEAEGAGDWKTLVTAPLRWMAAIEVDRDPCSWALGIIRNPEEALEALNAERVEIEEARRFARSDESLHVRNHARDAFVYLESTPQKIVAMQLRSALTKKGLL